MSRHVRAPRYVGIDLAVWQLMGSRGLLPGRQAAGWPASRAPPALVVHLHLVVVMDASTALHRQISSTERQRPARLVGGSASLLLAGALSIALAAAPAAAQDNVPVPPVDGTVALQGTVDEEYAAANLIIVKTMDGVRHVFHFTKDLLVHGGPTGPNPLEDLHKGTMVVVHYTVQSGLETAQEVDRIDAAGLKEIEGRVIRVDRGKKQISVRFPDGQTETFQLTDRAAVDAGKDVDAAGEDATVVIYYSDESGRKVAHFFRKAS